MTTVSINPTASDLILQRLFEDLAARNRGPASVKSHVRALKRFAVWLGRPPETATAEDVRSFQHHLPVAS